MTRRILFLLIGLALILSACSKGQAGDTQKSELTDLKQQSFFPVVYTRYQPFIGGVDTWSPGLTEEDAQKLKPTYLRTYMYWYLIEPKEGLRQWSKDFETQLAIAKKYGIQVIVTIKGGPGWALAAMDPACGRLSQMGEDALVAFAADAALRYPDVAYWEIWNEPDIPKGEYPYTGCWGDPEEEDFGGWYYAKVLNRVYDAIKSVTPQARVMFGGLSLECLDCPQADFLPGALKAGAKFDAMSFHHFEYYTPYSDEKLDFLGQKLAYLASLQDKPIFLTETSLLCDNQTLYCDSQFELAQASYLYRLDGFLSNQVGGYIWYSLQDLGWINSGMYLKDQPKPVYDMFVDLSR